MKRIEKYYALDAQDAPIGFKVLYTAKPGQSPVRASYQQFLCPRCQKLDTRQSLSGGLPPGIDFSSMASIHAMFTGDSLLVVSSRSREVIESIAPGEVEWFGFPDSHHFVMYPVHKFFPPIDAPRLSPVAEALPGTAFQIRGKQCPRCKRYKTTTFWPEWFAPPDGLILGAAVVEVGRHGNECFTWIACESVATQLLQIKGWRAGNIDLDRERLQTRLLDQD